MIEDYDFLWTKRELNGIAIIVGEVREEPDWVTSQRSEKRATKEHARARRDSGHHRLTQVIAKSRDGG